MSLSGVHIIFCTVSSPTVAPNATLPAGMGASQTMASAGTSTIAAPPNCPLLSLAASAPIFYAYGQNPDASSGSAARHYYDPATGREDVICNTGDRVAWAFA